jgi:hypothetical protein
MSAPVPFKIIAQPSGMSTLDLGDKKVDVSPDGGIAIAYSWDRVETRRKSAEEAEEAPLSISEDFSTFSINGVVINPAPDGAIVIAADPGVDVQLRKPSSGPSEETAPEPGQMTQEGIYIGSFADAGGAEKHWYADEADVKDAQGNRAALTRAEAFAHAQASTALGYEDWIVPPGWNDAEDRPDILSALFNSKSRDAFAGSFEETGANPAGWYWSAGQVPEVEGFARIQRFSDGARANDAASSRFSLRLVRCLPK